MEGKSERETRILKENEAANENDYENGQLDDHGRHYRDHDRENVSE